MCGIHTKYYPDVTCCATPNQMHEACFACPLFVKMHIETAFRELSPISLQLVILSPNFGILPRKAVPVLLMYLRRL